MKGFFKNKKPELSKRFGNLSQTAKEARICFNIFHIPRDISRIINLTTSYNKDRLVPFTKKINLINQGAAYSSLFMMLFQQMYLLYLHILPDKKQAKLYNRLYMSSWCSLILFNLGLKLLTYDEAKTSKDKEKQKEEKRLKKFDISSLLLDFIPAVSGSGLISFPDVVKGFAGTTSAIISIYTQKESKKI